MEAQQQLRRWLRAEQGSQGLEAAGAALAAALLVLALLLGARGTLGPSVERAFECAAAAIGGGGADCGGGAAGGSPTAPGGSTQAPADEPESEDCNFLCDVGGFFKGAGEVLWETVKGIGTLAWDAVKAATGDQETRDKYAAAWEAITSDPGGALSAIWHGIVDPIQEDWNAGREGEAIGRAFTEIISTIAGPKGIDKLGKLNKLDDVARGADRLGDAARTGDRLDEVSDAGRGVQKLPCVGLLPSQGKGPGLAKPLAAPCDNVDDWAQGFPRKNTPTGSVQDQYEIRQTGPENVQVSGGGAQIWVDGLRASDNFLLDAKYIDNPARSPFIEGSQIPPFIREQIVAKVDDEFRRYGAVINDPNTPARGLEVITNDARAVPFFEELMRKYNIPGQVVVQP